MRATRVHAHIYIYTHTHIHTYIHTHTHTHTQIYMRATKLSVDGLPGRNSEKSVPSTLTI
jgi:hypothetical protein